MNYFEKNLEVLKEHRPQLAETILAERIDEGVVQLSFGENGEPRVLFIKSDGEEVRIDRAEDPVKCARDVTDYLKATRPNQDEKEGLVVLFGFGLGYLAQEVLKHFETGHMMLIYEATPQLFKTTLEARDLTDVLESDKVEILIGPDVDNFSFVEKHHHHVVNGTWYMVADNPSRRLNPAAYERFHKRLTEQKQLTLANVGTAIGLGKNFADAILQNVPNILRRPGVTALKDHFEGRPAIVVAAGPSLEKNLHLLKKAASKAVIVAVDAALPTLVPAGIFPDLLVAIDPLAENVAFFRDNPLLKHVPFIWLTQYTPEVIDLYPGPSFVNITEQNLTALWLRPFWEDKGSVVCFGGSVAHLGFAMAEYLGCSPVALIGLDLSFDEKFHAGEASSLLSDGGPYDLRNGADKAIDIFGEQRYTLLSFLTFRTSFENRFKAFKGTVVNATEGGLPLEGTTNMRLGDFIDEYCDIPRFDVRDEIARLAKTNITYNLDGLIEEVEKTRDTLQEIRKHARRLLQYIKKVQLMRKEKDEGEEFHSTLDEIERLTEKVRHPSLNLIAAYHYQLELYLKRQAIIEIDEMEDKFERLDAQLDRGLTYYNQIQEAIVLFAKHLEALTRNLRREKKINGILRNETIPPKERLYRASMTARKAGRVARAVNYLETLHDMSKEEPPPYDQSLDRPEPLNLEIDLLLAELYMRQYRYHEARNLLDRISMRRAILKAGQQAKIDDLLETCIKKMSVWDERKAKMTALLAKAEESYGGSLESGLFYFRVGDYERAARAYESATKELSDSVTGPLVAAYYGLAHTYLKLKESQKAVDAFATALQIEPNNALIYRDLALLAIENGNVGSGEMFLTKALEIAPWSDEIYRLLAGLYVSSGESRKAIALYEYGIKVSPENTNLQKELALLYQDMILQKNQGEDRAG